VKLYVIQVFSVVRTFPCLSLFFVSFFFWFRYHFNNFLHHQVERMVVTILESGNAKVQEHLLGECELLSRILEPHEHTPRPRHPPRGEHSAVTNSDSYSDSYSVSYRDSYSVSYRDSFSDTKCAGQ